MNKNTGGPAFPEQQGTDVHGEKYSISPGMTLRDYFAANVQVDFAVVEKVIVAQGKDRASVEQISKIEAVIRYSKAEALLAERAK